MDTHKNSRGNEEIPQASLCKPGKSGFFPDQIWGQKLQFLVSKKTTMAQHFAQSLLYPKFDLHFALGSKHGRTEPWSNKIWEFSCCGFILTQHSIFAKTANSLHWRINGRRSKFYEITYGRAVDITRDKSIVSAVFKLPHILKYSNTILLA